MTKIERLENAVAVAHRTITAIAAGDSDGEDKAVRIALVQRVIEKHTAQLSKLTAPERSRRGLPESAKVANSFI